MRSVSKFGWGMIALSLILSIWILGGRATRADSSAITIVGDKVTSYNPTATSADVVSIPTTVTTIGEGAFNNALVLSENDKLTSLYTEDVAPAPNTIYLQGNITTIGSQAFAGKHRNITEVIFPLNDSRVATIGSFAFSGNDTIRTISLPASLTSIGEGAFKGTLIDEITLHANYKPTTASELQKAFSGASHLKYIDIEDNSQYISKNGIVFNHAGNNLIYVPEGNADKGSIEDRNANNAFSVPDGTTSIEAGAFANCNKINQVLIPKSVTSIGKQGDWVPKLVYGYYDGVNPSAAYNFVADLQNQHKDITFINLSESPYTVSFLRASDGTVLSTSITVTSAGQTITNPIPSYTWYTDRALNNVFNFSTPIYDNLVLYAEPSVGPTPSTEYEVKFYYNGELLETKVVPAGSTVTPTNKTPLGVTVTWYRDPAFTSPFDFTLPINGPYSLHGKGSALTPTYLVTFNANGGTIDGSATKQISLGTGDTLPGADRVVRSGYTFGGWYTDAACTNPYTSVNANTTVYAKWTPVAGTTYVVTFYKNDGTGGTFGSYPSVPAGTTITEPTQKPTRSGYTFSGWYTTEACTQGTGFNFGYTPINANTSLYAKWIPSGTTKYSVVLSLNGGTLNGYTGSVTQMFDPMTSVSSIPTPTRTGYVFGGWYKDAGCTIPATYITENTTLYAKWNDGGTDPNMCTITFNSNGGSSVASIKVSKNSYITRALETPTKAGYRFTGWYTDPACLNLFNPSQQITTNMTLFAGWVSDANWAPGGGSGTGSAGNGNVNVNGNNNNVTYQVNGDGTVTKTQGKDNTPKTADNFDERWLLCLAMFMVGIASVLLSSRNRAKLILEKVNSRN